MKYILNRQQFKLNEELDLGEEYKRPGDPYVYIAGYMDNGDGKCHWYAKRKKGGKKWFEISGKNFKPGYEKSIKILDEENPGLRPAGSPWLNGEETQTQNQETQSGKESQKDNKQSQEQSGKETQTQNQETQSGKESQKDNQRSQAQGGTDKPAQGGKESQQGGGVDSKEVVPQKVIDFIFDVEKKYSYVGKVGDKSKIFGREFTQKDNRIAEIGDYITDTIGWECWNRMPEKLRAQIYSYCFQSDAEPKGEYKYRFIAGLAQAIDPVTIKSRPDIISKKAGGNGNETAQKQAIDIIKNCKEFNDKIYNDYLKIVDQQYLGLSKDEKSFPKGTYKFIWKYRPIAVDRFMNGEETEKILSEWMEKSKGETTPQTGEGSKAEEKSGEQKSSTNNSNADELFSKIKSSDEFEDLTKVYKWAKGELPDGKRDFSSKLLDGAVKPKIIEGYEENVKGLDQYLKDYKTGKLTKQKLSSDLEAKIKEAEETDTLGHDKAVEFKQAAIALLQKMKTEILPKLN